MNFILISFFFLVGLNAKANKNSRNLLNLYLIAAIMNSIIGIMQAFDLFPNCVEENRGMCGLTYNPNFNSLFSSVGLIIILKLISEKKSLWNYLNFIILLASIILSNSIQGIVILLLLIALMYLRTKNILVPLIFIIGFVFIYFFMPDIKDYEGNFRTWEKRIIASRIGFEIGVNNFYTGVGIDNLISEFPKYIRESDLTLFRPTEMYTHTHNIFTQYFACLGIMALIAVFVIYIKCLTLVLRFCFAGDSTLTEQVYAYVALIFLFSCLISIPELYLEIVGFTSLGFLKSRDTEKNAHK